MEAFACCNSGRTINHCAVHLDHRTAGKTGCIAGQTGCINPSFPGSSGYHSGDASTGLGDQTAIHYQGMTTDIIAGAGTEEDRSARHIFCTAQSAHGNLLRHGLRF